MANRQIYQLTARTLAKTDVLPTQNSAGSSEAGKNTVQDMVNLVFPYTGSARVTGSLIVTGSVKMTNGSITVEGSQDVNYTLAPSLRGDYIYPLSYTAPWLTNDGTYFHIPTFPFAQGVLQSGQTGGGVSTIYGYLQVGSEYYDDTSFTQYLRAQTIWRDTTDSGTPGSPTFYPKPVYRTVITDNSTVDGGANQNTTIGTLVTANGRKHVLTVTGSLLARDSVSLGTSLTNTHIISGSVTISDILTLAVRTTTPASPQEGMIIASGSAGASILYYYNGSTWNALF